MLEDGLFRLFGQVADAAGHAREREEQLVRTLAQDVKERAVLRARLLLGHVGANPGVSCILETPVHFALP